MLSYRSYGCCRQIYKKLFHTLFHILAVPAIVMGFITVLDSHNLAVPSIPNFYSIHSWMGLTTMGLFAIQVFRMVISFWAKRWPDIYLTALKKKLSCFNQKVSKQQFRYCCIDIIMYYSVVY